MAAALKRHRVSHQLIRLKGYDHLFDVFPAGWPSQEPPTELKDPRVLAAFDSLMVFLKTHVGR